MSAIYDIIAAKLVKAEAKTPGATIDEIVRANEILGKRYESVTAIFTGATHGCGFGTLRMFVKRIPKPRAIIVGRSRSRFEDEMESLKLINPDAELTFIEGDLSLIKGVDAICDEVMQHLAGAKVDLLCMSQGYAPLQGRDYTPEGLDLLLELVYYGRMRMIRNLLDAQVLKTNARVVSILAGTYEGKVYEDDLALKQNFSLLAAKAHFASLTTLTLDDFAKNNPEMMFLHIFPGTVKTGFLYRSVTWTVLKLLIGYVLEPVITLGGITVDECGERMLWAAFDEHSAKLMAWSRDFDGSENHGEGLRTLQSHRQNRPLQDLIRIHLKQVFEKAIAK